MSITPQKKFSRLVFKLSLFAACPLALLFAAAGAEAEFQEYCVEKSEHVHGQPSACTLPSDLDCIQDSNPLQVQLTINASGVVIQGGGSIAYTFQIPAGCKGNGPYINTEPCLLENEDAVYFSGNSSGTTTHTLLYKNCPTKQKWTCTEPPVTLSIEEFPGWADTLEPAIRELFGDDAASITGFNVSLPVVYCKQDGQANGTVDCYGGPEESSNYAIEQTPCPEEE